MKRSLVEKLEKLKAAGLTLADCIIAFGPEDEREEAIAGLAREQWQRDGEVEIDPDTVVSEGGDNGAYVMAWVWVDFSGTEFDKEVG